MTTRSSALALALLLAACGDAPTSIDTDRQTDAGDEPRKELLAIEFPAVDGWEALPRMDLGAGQGYRVGYNSADVAVTVFVYDRGVAEIPDGAASELLGREFETTIQQIYSLLSLGEYESVNEVVRDVVSLGPAGETIEMLRSRVDIVTSAGHALRSHVYLAGLRNHFVKLRTSSNGLDESTEALRLEALLQALGRTLSGVARG